MTSPDYHMFDGVIHTVGSVGLSPCLVEQRLDTTFVDSRLVAIERIAGVRREMGPHPISFSGSPPHLAGLRDVAEFLSQVEQAELVFDDAFVSFQHEGYLSWALLVVSQQPPNSLTLALNSEVSD